MPPGSMINASMQMSSLMSEIFKIEISAKNIHNQLEKPEATKPA